MGRRAGELEMPSSLAAAVPMSLQLPHPRTKSHPVTLYVAGRIAGPQFHMLSPNLQDALQRIRIALETGAENPMLTSLANELRVILENCPDEASALVEEVAALLVALEATPDNEQLTSDLQACLKELEGYVTVEEWDVDPEILEGFLDDRTDSLDELEDLALTLESADDPESRDSIHRLVHSIKGDAGVLGLDDLSTLCHELEDNLEDCAHDEAGRLTIEAVERMRIRFKQLALGPGATLEEASVDESCEVVTAEVLAKTPEPIHVEMPEPDELGEVDAELTGEFVTEAREHLEAVDASLLLLERDDEAERLEAVNATFRAFHTIKGLAGFLNLNIMMRLAHEAEAMLHKVRSDEIQLTGYIVDAAFEVNDALKSQVMGVENSLATGTPVHPPEDYPVIVTTLMQAASGVEPTARAAKVEAQAAEAVAPALAVEPDATPTPEASAPEASAPAEEHAAPAADHAAPAEKQVAPAAKAAAPRANIVRGTIKVDASRLDDLVDTIGELVIAEAMVSQCDELPEEGAGRLTSLLSQLDKTTRELQEMAMSLRMVPIRATFRRMARLARDVSHKLDKPVEFVTRGDDTELDKTVVDVIGDPLVHMVRNAIDHGIEATKEDRIAAGKPEIGRIELRAFHQGGSIHVEIEDDGRGLDRDKILAKAMAAGLVQGEPELLTDSDIFAFIFAPGFSTTDVVTEVSGRGVGLDVVRRNIEGMRGRIEIRSTPGKGTLFSIRLPLTLAIIDGMIVRVSQRRYIVPTLSIIRMFRPKHEEVTTVLESGKLLRVGDELVSLTRLDEMFGLPRSPADLTEMSAIVVESGLGHFAFLVDELLGQQQIVIKPLGAVLTQLDGFAGGAIMPDGNVGLILDIAGLVELAATSPDPVIPETQESQEALEA